MLLAPDGEEIEIANAAGEVIARTLPIARLHAGGSPGLPIAARRSLGEMGWFALALGAEAGGSGLSAVEHALFFRELGRHCGPIDVLAQSLSVLSAGDPALRGALASGEQGAALAVEDGDSWRILGSGDAGLALAANSEGARIFTLTGLAVEARASLDPATAMHIATGKPRALLAQAAGSHIWRMGQLGTAAMLIGIAEAALDQIVEYAKIRETFGRKIGSWQAVRHPCADMAIRLEAARAQLWFAAAALKEARGDVDVHLDAAKLLANQAAVANADSNIQLHGGIGVTDEHHAHLYLKHALLLARLFGSRRGLLARLLHATVED